MISMQVWWAFLGYTVPMVFSPGPGNTVLATTGGSRGLRGSLPFWAGFEAGNLALCTAYGFGLGRTLQDHPAIHFTLRWAGVAYLLFLAWGFFRSTMAAGSATPDPTPTRLGFGEGALAVVLNPKIHTMIVVMFSQFLGANGSLLAQAAELSAGFLVVCVLCHLPWVYGGKLLLGGFRSARALRIQGWLFGGSMLMVAGFLALT